ncbi:aromatic amino acid lyase [Bacillus subtilis subsp. subtilis]
MRKAKFEGEVLTGEEALIKAKIKKMKLGYKEGLALINGTLGYGRYGCYGK